MTLRAAGDGHIVAVREFLSAGVDFVSTAAERSKKTALILAARGGHLEVNFSRRATKTHETEPNFTTVFMEMLMDDILSHKVTPVKFTAAVDQTSFLERIF